MTLSAPRIKLSDSSMNYVNITRFALQWLLDCKTAHYLRIFSACATLDWKWYQTAHITKMPHTHMNINALLTQNIKLNTKRRYFTHFIPPSTFPMLKVKQRVRQFWETVQSLCCKRGDAVFHSVNICTSSAGWFLQLLCPAHFNVTGETRGGLGMGNVPAPHSGCFHTTVPSQPKPVKAFCWIENDWTRADKQRVLIYFFK